MEDNDAADADAADTFDEAGKLFSLARIGIPPIILSLLACIAPLASLSELKATNQTPVLPLTNACLGRINSLVKADKISIGLTSEGRSITAMYTASLSALAAWCACCWGGIDSIEAEDGLSEPTKEIGAEFGCCPGDG